MGVSRTYGELLRLQPGWDASTGCGPEHPLRPIGVTDPIGAVASPVLGDRFTVLRMKLGHLPLSPAKRGRTGVDRARALPGERSPVPVATVKWRAALPEDAWPRDFADSGCLWRADVFAVADQWRIGVASARSLLAATLMWTYGEQPGGRRRTVRALAGDPSGELLETALLGLRGDRPGVARLRGAYLALRTTARLPEMDSDTCTRLLYFGGYRLGAGGVQPLILDEEIVRHLPPGAEVSSPASRGSSLEWVRYIAWVAEQAGELEEPDRVEMDLAAGGARYGAASGRARSGAVKNGEARGRHARR